MPTFLLKKYNQAPNEHVGQEAPQQTDQQKEEDKEKIPESMTITVSGSISQIVATALNKVLENTDVNVEQTETEDQSADVKAISTENINEEPVDTLRNIHDNDFVFIHTKGFNTAQEEWFLTNVANKTNKVVYTLESFINHVKAHFKLA